MNLPIILKLFIIVLLAAGFIELYDHFSLMGVPTSVGEVINSHVLGALIFILIGIGLVYRWPKAYTASRALALIGLIVPPAVVLCLLFFWKQAVLFGVVLQTLRFSIPPSLLSSITAQLISVVVSLSVWALLCWLVWRALRSEEVALRFDEDRWFGQHLTVGFVDFRILIFMGLIIGVRFVDSITPAGWSKTRNEKLFSQVVKEIESLPEIQAQNAMNEVARMEKMKPFKYPRVCSFSHDERSMTLISGDGTVYMLDVATGKIRSFQWERSLAENFDTPSSRDRLAPDGDLFFDARYRILRRFSDVNYRARSPVEAGDSFLGFSNVKTILYFSNESKTIIAFDLDTKKSVWRATLGYNLKAGGGEAVWSSTRQWLYLAGQHNPDEPIHYFINTHNGRLQELPFHMYHLGFAWTDVHDRWMTLSGPVSRDRRIFNTYKIDLPSLNVTQISGEKPVEPAWGAKLYRGEIDFTRGAAEPPPDADGILKEAIETAVVDDGRKAILLKDKERQAFLYIFKNGVYSRIGQQYSDKQFGKTTHCLAVSRTRRLIGLTLGKSLEVFWASQFDSPNPRTFFVESVGSHSQ